VERHRLERRPQHVPGRRDGTRLRIADRIHSSGRAIVWSGHKEAAELYWEQLRGYGLTMAPLERS